MSFSHAQSGSRSSILAQRHQDDANRYLARHAYTDLPPLPAPDPRLGMVAVIPAMAEPALARPLASLAAAARPDCAVEVILVINAPDDAAADVRRQTAESLQFATSWAASNATEYLHCHVLDYPALPARHAGVGLARKLGMDVALTRLAASDTGRGIISCLDADCEIEVNYWRAIEAAYTKSEEIIAATVNFEHPLEETEEALRNAIIDYEMHLRCYRQGLKFSESNYARHTVGSAVTVRSEIYAQEGGMNRRAAGEDFYFINKLLKRGQVGEINSTTVYPSARLSRRVPFGTGAAMWQRQTTAQLSYAPASYRLLKIFRKELWENTVREQGPSLTRYVPFVETSGFPAWLVKTRANVASEAALRVQFNRWFDGFREMKFLNWLSESEHPKVPVMHAADEILRWADCVSGNTPGRVLEQLRQLDRGV